MNSDANPILTLVWTFALMSLFAVGGANSAIPEMHRVAVDVRHWITDQQFADVFGAGSPSWSPPCRRRWLFRHGSIRSGYCWPGVVWVLLALSDENR
jgi:hypothetical protein